MFIFCNKTPLHLASKYSNQEIFNLLIEDKRILFGDDVFFNCTSLKKIQIPSFITEIGKNAFGGCCSLAEIQIPNSVTKIGDFAFNKCTSLTHITIPQSVTEIGNNIFDGCSSLKVISIPDSLKSNEKLGINKTPLIKII